MTTETQAPEGAQLPPLPEPHWPRGYQGAVPSGGYTADQMHAYARAALAAPAPQAPVALTDAQVDRLYANVPPSAQQDARSREAFRRLVRVVEAAHGIKEQQ